MGIANAPAHRQETKSRAFPEFQKMNGAGTASLPMISPAGTETRVFRRIVNATAAGIIGDD
jgi:hypothetical protein